MDEVQKFIANNQHQFGYIMQEASRQWIAKDPVGALTVGDCNAVIKKHGEYHKLIEENARLREALEFYADAWIYTSDDPEEMCIPEIFTDQGEKARHALERTK